MRKILAVMFLFGIRNLRCGLWIASVSFVASFVCGCGDGNGERVERDAAVVDTGFVTDSSFVDTGSVIDSSLTPSEPAALAGITAAHNQARANVGVGPLVWDSALAASAQAWADSCTDNDSTHGFIDHNDNRSVGHPWYVGENIYASSGAALAANAVATWTSESQHYNYSSDTCSSGHVCEHYTQVVWAASTRIGCGISDCPALTFRHSIVCNYGPGGNTGGKPY